MARKWPEKPQVQPYEFSQLYRDKKVRIQEMWYSDFIEFLNWVENVNNWKKKEEWKMIVDQVFNKYSDQVIISLFERFRSFKRNKPEWYKYEKILNEIKEPLRTEIYGDNIVKKFFGWYGNYLKFVKRNRLKAEAEAMEEVIQERVAETLREWAKNRYTGDDENIVNEDGDVVPNPKYEHIPVENPEVVGDERITVTRMEKSKKEEKVEENKEDKPKKWPEQLEIPFEYED